MIDNKILDNARLLNGYSSEDINSYKKIDEAMHDKLIKEQNYLYKIRFNPYCGKLDIEFKEDNEKETVYIGRRGLEIDDNIIHLIY